jgi:hypothetical protein
MCEPTGEKHLKCGAEEITIYQYHVDPDHLADQPPVRSITGHARSSRGDSDCPITFTYYRLKGDAGAKEEVKEKVPRGQSSATHTFHWLKVTAKCEEAKSDKEHDCWISWTEKA